VRFAFAELFGAPQRDSDDDVVRTEANFRAAEGAIWFGSTHTTGYRCTREWAAKLNKPMLCEAHDKGPPLRSSKVERWLSLHHVRVLNVAGNRETKAPGISLRVERFLGRVFVITQRATLH
jgi:Circularly permutated YpsA SLOG family